MAPSVFTPGENAPSVLLTSASTSVATPPIIFVTSVIGISFATFFIIVAIILLRQFRSPSIAKPPAEPIPRLVITDTSMFPASSVVLEKEADLDKVIASFKPLGKESHIVEEEIALPNVSYVSNDIEAQVSPPPKFSGPQSYPIPRPDRAHVSPGNHKKTKADIESSNSRLSKLLSCGDISPHKSQSEGGTWWFDFRGASFDSAGSLSDVDENSSSDSDYSTSSCETPANTKSPQRPLSTISVLDKALGDKSSNGTGDCSRVSGIISGSQSGDVFDKDILAYCWRLSDEGNVGKEVRRSSLRSNRSMIVTVRSSRDKPLPIPTHSSSTIDPRILEYCQRLPNDSSLESIDPAVARFARAIHSVSNVSLTSEEPPPVPPKA